MNKIFKKVISLALIGTLCIGASTTTFASELSPEAKAEATQTNESERKVNWWQVGWKVLSDYFEKLIDLDGQSVKDSNWAYLVSPSIEFNTGEMGLQTYALCKSIFLDLSILSKHFCFSPILYLYANSHVLCFVWRINRRKMAYVEKCIFFLCSYRLFQLTRSTLPFSSASFIHAVK